MGRRETVQSTTVEYQTDVCLHCDQEVFVDDTVANIDGLPEGVTVVIGGGDHLSVDQTGFTARGKDYRSPRTLVKWFFGETEVELTQQYMCPSCARAVYGVGE